MANILACVSLLDRAMTSMMVQTRRRAIPLNSDYSRTTGCYLHRVKPSPLYASASVVPTTHGGPLTNRRSNYTSALVLPDVGLSDAYSDGGVFAHGVTEPAATAMNEDPLRIPSTFVYWRKYIREKPLLHAGFVTSLLRNTPTDGISPTPQRQGMFVMQVCTIPKI